MHKRSISNISPEASPESKKPQISEMTLNNMSISDLGKLLDEKLSDHLQHLVTKADLDVLTTKMAAAEEKQLALAHKVASAEERCEKLEMQIEHLMMKFNEKNVIVHLPSKTNVDPLNEAKELCQSLAEGDENTVDPVKLTHTNTNSDIEINHLVVTLKHSSDVYKILKASSKLKNTGRSVHKDYPLSVRTKRAKMIKLKKSLYTERPGTKIQLRDDRLFIEGRAFAWSTEHGLKCGNENGFVVLKKMFPDVRFDSVERAVNFYSNDKLHKN